MGKLTGIPKTLHFVVRVVTVALVLVIALTCLVLFILGIVQAQYPNAGDAFPSAQQSHYAFNNLNTSCGQEEYKSHLPLRFKALNSANGNSTNTTNTTPDSEFTYCGWKPINTWIRSVATLVTGLFCLFLMDRLWRRTPATGSSAIWAKPRRVLKAILIPIGASGFVFFIMMIVDGNDVRNSRDWCLNSLNTDTANIFCDYNTFILTVMFDVMIFLLWGAVVGLILVRYKWFNKYMQLQDDNEDRYEMT